MDWIVMKFGGTSMTSACLNKAAREIAKNLDSGCRCFVVCSALHTVTDLLQELLKLAAANQHQTQVEKIKRIHRQLGEAFELDTDQLLISEFAELERLATGLSLIGDTTERTKARLLALGELMSTRLATAILDGQGLTCSRLDARQLLTSQDRPHESPGTNYLEAVCQVSANPELQKRLQATDPRTVYVTQGFIAANPQKETVLLGRGGSDVSAAYFAVLLEAKRLEMFTDVAGIYTADPHLVPSARLLRALDYAEAQELASVGAKVVHPRCLPPLAQANIPVLIRCTHKPELEGTVISSRSQGGAQVKAVATRSSIILIAMEDLGMWQQVGFLAKCFKVFANHRLSIDLVATSQTNVTVSLDATANQVDQQTLDLLFEDLKAFCVPRLIAPCASISLVGSKIRSNLHKLGPALELFEEERVHLLSQASSDLNLTFVVDQSQVGRLLTTLHAQLFSGVADENVFGPSWRTGFETRETLNNCPGRGWWKAKREQLLALAKHTPAYVYDRDTLAACAKQLQCLSGVSRVMYAMKANANEQILRLFYELGLGFECVSTYEVQLVRELFPNLQPGRMIFTPNFADKDDYQLGFAKAAMVTIDNLQVLESWPEVFSERKVLLRLDLGHGSGHHRKVRTAGSYSKFGIPVDELERAVQLVRKHNVEVIGLHAHSGSGIKTADTWSRSAAALAQIAEHYFGDVHILDLGGGLGVPERPDADSLDLQALNEQLLAFRKTNPKYDIWIEPGRYLVSQAGVLLATVTQTKDKGIKHFIGINAGMNNLIRPTLYGAYHEIRNLTNLEGPNQLVADIVGPICETGDFLGHDRQMPATNPGDLLIIATAGAYGQAMSSNYNLRPQAQELFV